ncbi:MAG: GTPase HflX [Saezia sp.]
MTHDNKALQSSATSVFLVGVGFGGDRLSEESLDELSLLAESAGLIPAGRLPVHRQSPDSAYFVGSGKVDEIRMLAQACGATEILFDQAISPGQQRNLEKRMEMPVNDRTFLILEIFAQRARSHVGRIQVELARLQYLSSRLVRRWSHLDKQRGGTARGGAGEKQIELDRRILEQQIKSLKQQLEKVKTQTNTQSRARMRNDVFRVSLVGYTNAGKSTLFNALVKAKAYAADQLFATLDTTIRSLYLEQANCSVSLSDTVGFIRDLPHGLVKAFAATLQEAAQADLLLHVVDASNPKYQEQIAQVQLVLEEIGALKVPQVLVFNKIDALPDDAEPRQMCDWYEVDGVSLRRIFASAKKGVGLDELRQTLTEYVLARQQKPQDLSVNAD